MKGLRIGGSEDVKGYGGFSLRVRMPPDLTFHARPGQVTPLRTSVDAGPWLSLNATYGGSNQTGIAVFGHPTNPGAPQPWILRQKRSMQNPVFPGRDPVAIPRDKPLELRYRLVLYRGPVKPEAIEQWYRDFCDTRPVYREVFPRK